MGQVKTYEEILEELRALSPAEQKQVIAAAAREKGDRVFIPFPGPQAMALESQADEVFYGGAAGCGKSSLLVGAALEYKSAILFRKEYTQIKGLEDEAARQLGTREGYNGQAKAWKHRKGVLEFGSVPHVDDREKYQGRAHAYIGFDEITHFPEAVYRYLIGWNRSAEGERCRVIVTGNPPTTPEGRWVIRYWAPWIDPSHPNPAKHGELRWFTTVDGEDLELPGPEPIELGGRMVQPRSRTFIGGRLADNPALAGTNYAATLDALPEPLRTMLREGRFDVGQADSDNQLIPTHWVNVAQTRWDRKPTGRMDAVGVDVAQGGADKTVLVARHGQWFSEPVVRRGEDTPDGPSVAALVVQTMRDGAEVIVDCGGGFGGSAYDHLKQQNVPVVSFVGSRASSAKTKDGTLAFVNQRAESWWRFREALDPVMGEGLAIPPNPELLADLTSVSWKLTSRGIQLESKDDLRKRLGRSPDMGDAFVLAWLRHRYTATGTAAPRFKAFQAKANLGHAAAKRTLRR